MDIKKIIIILLLLNVSNSNVYSIEPDVFVQSTVNRASQILSKDISKEDKINELKSIAKETVDIKGVGFYSVGSKRKELNDSQKKGLSYYQEIAERIPRKEIDDYKELLTKIFMLL